MELRSRDYGSPQCRQRLYIFGVRGDVADMASLRSLISYFKFLSSTHADTSITDIIAWVPQLLGKEPEVICGMDSSSESRKECRAVQHAFIWVSFWDSRGWLDRVWGN